jgi:hypothetical protein
MHPMMPAVYMLMAAMGQPAVEATPITPGLVDVTPSAVDLFIQPLILEEDSNFERVYRLDPDVRFFGREGPGFARRRGAITAVFPRSVYVPLGGGVSHAAIPPGTVFMIGETGRGAPSAPADAVWAPVTGPDLRAGSSQPPPS